MPARHTTYTISPSPDSTIAVEIREGGLLKRKHLFVFEEYRGTLVYDPDAPLETVLNLTVQADSLTCRDAHGKQPGRLKRTSVALKQALAAHQYSTIQARSERFIAKPLRGFVVEGIVCLRGTEHPLKANIGFGVLKRDRLQIDADASLSLSRFGMPRPSSFLGLVHTEDEATLHALIWGVIAPG